MMQWVIRFLVGGAVVSAFAVLGDIVRPKGFAGLFGAAPSIALASLALMVHLEGALYASTQARSMACGAAAFCVYALACMCAMSKLHWRASRAAVPLLGLWGVVAFGLWAALLRT